MISPAPDNHLQSMLNPKDYYAHVTIPETWHTLEEFFNWFVLDAKMPLMVPWDAPIVRGDDFTAISIFRKGSYQVELFLEHPALYIKSHSHPNVETIVMQLGGGACHPSREDFNMATRWGIIDWKKSAGTQHGDEPLIDRFSGCALLSFQRWLHDEPVSSVACHWKGTTSGPMHDSVIREQYPDMMVEGGYADVTLSMQEHIAIQEIVSGKNT